MSVSRLWALVPALSLDLGCSGGDKEDEDTAAPEGDADTDVDSDSDTDTGPTTVPDSLLTDAWAGICPATFLGPTTPGATGIGLTVDLVEHQDGSVAGSGTLELQAVNPSYNLLLPGLVSGSFDGSALEIELFLTEITLGPEFHGVMVGTLSGNEIVGDWRFYHYGLNGGYDAWPCTLDRR